VPGTDPGDEEEQRHRRHDDRAAKGTSSAVLSLLT
jgi:hypothetical protein